MNSTSLISEMCVGFKPLPKKLEGWCDKVGLLYFVEKAKPKSIIEVGAWLGLSAITMGKAVKQMGINPVIRCVDTWLGATEFWDGLNTTAERDLMLKFGYPQVYYQFVSNVIHEGLGDCIIPWPMNSISAPAICNRWGIRADLIYIDGEHEEDMVRPELKRFWPLVEHGGVLCGDDYDCAGVKKAVDEFASKQNLPLEVKGRVWGFVKPQMGERGLNYVMTTYNRPEYLKRTLNSLRENPIKNGTLHIYDDASDPETKQIISDFAQNSGMRVEVTFRPQNIGCDPNICQSLWDVLQKTGDEYVVNLESDIVFHPDWEKQYFLQMRKLFDKGIRFGGLTLFQTESQMSNVKSFDSELMECEIITGMGLMVSWDIMRQIMIHGANGGWDWAYIHYAKGSNKKLFSTKLQFIENIGEYGTHGGFCRAANFAGRTHG